MERKQKITSVTKYVASGKDKILYCIKISTKALKAFPCEHVVRELICQGVDGTTLLQVTEVVVVSKDSLLKFGMPSRKGCKIPNCIVDMAG